MQPSMQALMAVDKTRRDLTWLRDSLQAAVQVELSTIPLYLAAYWSLKDPTSPRCALAGQLLQEIVLEEMGHMGLVCNMLSALGQSPLIASEEAAPVYPGPLPGRIHPGLRVTPSRYSDHSLQSFLAIEYPENQPVALFWSAGQTYATIGAFYTAIADTFRTVQLPVAFDTMHQLEREDVSVTIIHDKDEALKAIDLIKQQGEGTSMSPLEADGDVLTDDNLAHFYKFSVLYHKHDIRVNPAAPHGYDFMGKEVLVPRPDDVFPMADVPPGGFADSKDFDMQYSGLLQKLQEAWSVGTAMGTNLLKEAIKIDMRALANSATTLLKAGKPAPGGFGIVGPSFQFRAS